MATTVRRREKPTDNYSYEIAAIPSLSPDIIKRLDPWAVLEFFRIEALLRSEKIRVLYHKFMTSFTEKKFKGLLKDLKSSSPTRNLKYFMEDALFVNYRVAGGFTVIEGTHHALYLNPESEYLGEFVGLACPNPEVVDLEKFYKAEQGFRGQDFQTGKSLEDMILEKSPRYLWVRLDAASPPGRILAELKKELSQRHKQVKNIPPLGSSPDVLVGKWGILVRHYTHPRKQSPIRDFTTWVQYFRCYDLRQFKKLEYGPIAKEVYLTPESQDDSKKRAQARDRAEKAYFRVKRLIKAAEQDDWPPTRAVVK